METDSWSPGMGSLNGESFRDKKNECPKTFCEYSKIQNGFNTYRFSQYPDVYPGSLSLLPEVIPGNLSPL